MMTTVRNPSQCQWQCRSRGRRLPPASPLQPHSRLQGCRQAAGTHLAASPAWSSGESPRSPVSIRTLHSFSQESFVHMCAMGFCPLYSQVHFFYTFSKFLYVLLFCFFNRSTLCIRFKPDPIRVKPAGEGIGLYCFSITTPPPP